MLAVLKSWWLGFSPKERIWILIGLTFVATLVVFLWPVKDDDERRKIIGRSVLNDAVGAAKKSLPVSAEHEQSFTDRFWERIQNLFR